MIIRLADDGPYELRPELDDILCSLDIAVDAAVGSRSEERFAEALAALVDLVRTEGRRLNPSDVTPADIVLPPPGSSLEAYRLLLDSEAFEC